MAISRAQFIEEPLEQQMADVAASRVAGNNDRDLGFGAVRREERMRYAERFGTVFGDEPDRVRPRLNERLQIARFDVIDHMKEAAVEILGRGAIEDAAIRLRVARKDRADQRTAEPFRGRPIPGGG